MIAKWLRDRGEVCLPGALALVCLADTLWHSLGLPWGRLCDWHDLLLTREMEKP
jgi:hypothetical protein